MDGDVLVVNAGSSSLKVKLPQLGRSVTIERLGSGATARDENGPLEFTGVETHTQALGFALAHLSERPDYVTPDLVGHRIVHGGTTYRSPTLVDDAVEADVARLARLAPLHNPANLEALRAARRLLPAAQHVAVFDTAFHASLPRRAYLYGLPLDYALEQGLRRYGFHGTSHDYVTRRAAQLLGRPRADLKLVSLHLGNGASGAAVSAGASVDTSMGFTPLEGLLMGTRSGDIDPGLIVHLLRNDMNVDELDELLNRGSGLKGVSGVSHDMRDVRAAAAAGNEAAAAALEVFTYRIRKLIGAYAAAMGGLDAVVFTGGIGENDAVTRRESVHGLGFMGIELDHARNAAGDGVISVANGAVSVLVIKTDEEALIAEDARAIASRSPRESAA
jgi:acetate kinase